MTNYNKHFALLAAVCILFTGCEDDLFGGYGTAKVGDAIVFGGKLNYHDADNSKTRTVYGEKGETGTAIHWYPGDKVHIYCTDGTNIQNSEYVVNETTTNPWTNSAIESTITPKDESGLQWTSETATHTFYAAYPSASQFAEGNTASSNYKLEGNTLTAYLPNSQAPKTYLAASDGNYTIHPAMRYAYMVATTSSTLDAANKDGLTLNFYPIVTAVQISFTNKNTEPIEDIASVNISTVDGTPIAGLINANITEKTYAYVTGEDAMLHSTVNIATYDNNLAPITLASGKTLTITAFLLPTKNLTSLKISLQFGGGSSKTAIVEASDFNTTATDGVLIQTKKKNFLNNIPISFAAADISSNWMSLLDDNISLNNLSIPGAGGASSSGITTGDINKQQTLTITQLWNKGVRCFEFLVDNNSSFGSQNIYCNLENTNTTLTSAVNTIIGLIEDNPLEFAMVIIGYQETNTGSYDRQSGSNNGWGDRFYGWWNGITFSKASSSVTKNGETVTITHGKAIYTHSTTVGEARGKIFCIARPSSIGIDAGWYTGFYTDTEGTVCDYVSILGWGNNADQWYARGFGNLKVSNPSSDDVWSSTPNTLVNARPYAVSNASGPTISYTPSSNKNFAYAATNVSYKYYEELSNSNSNMAWVQEWRRVVPNDSLITAYSDKSYKITKLSNATAYAGGNGNNYYYNWAPSMYEKWDDIKDAFTKSMTKDGNYMMYINSLCGYFVDASIELSFKPRITFQKAYYDPSGWATNQIRYCMDDKYMKDHFSWGAEMNNRSLTSSIGGYDKPTIDDWGPYTATGGYKGNIEAFAHWINDKFYNHIKSLGADGLTGPTGVILMDRVSNDKTNDPAGYYLPQIILNNNFKSSVSAATALSLRRSDLEEGDAIAAPARRATGTSKEGIVWE